MLTEYCFCDIFTLEVSGGEGAFVSSVVGMGLNYCNTATLRTAAVPAAGMLKKLFFDFIPHFLPQNGRTALSAAEEAFHQDIAELLRTDASESTSSAKLL